MFSVIIPTCDRPDLLSLCLNNLAPGGQSVNPDSYEVIVTDDGINDTTKSLIEKEYSWVRWVNGPKKGPAANRNNGARYAESKWLVFTDDDCLPARDWLKAYKEATVQHPNSKAFEGAILPDNFEALKEDMAECPVNNKGGLFWSANIMVEKKLFEAVGGFDEEFIMAANEDQEIYKKIMEQGIVPFYDNAIVIHPVKIISLSKKIALLPKSETSQILLRYKQHYSVYSNYFDGVRIHLFSGFDNLRKKKFKRLLYNTAGLFYRLLFCPLIIYKVYRRKV